MSAGVLRAHVDQHFVRTDVKFNDTRIFECQAHCSLLPAICHGPRDIPEGTRSLFGADVLPSLLGKGFA